MKWARRQVELTQKVDLVLRLEYDDSGNEVLLLYKVIAVPKGHNDVGSNDLISCCMFECLDDAQGEPVLDQFCFLGTDMG